MKPPGATLPFGPLWFLGVYLIVVAVSPALIAPPPAVRLVGAGGDGRRHGRRRLRRVRQRRAGVRWFNVAFVLLFPHQLGHFYARRPAPAAAETGVLGDGAGRAGGLVLLDEPPGVPAVRRRAAYEWFPGIGYYPKSLLGTDVERVSNAYPPTVCSWSRRSGRSGAVLLLRPALSRWLQRPGPWKVTIYLNSVIMTLFLWHMTAYLLAILLLWPLGFGQQPDTTASVVVERSCGGRAGRGDPVRAGRRLRSVRAALDPGSPVHGEASVRPVAAG